VRGIIFELYLIDKSKPMELLRSQTNALFELIEKAGLFPPMFTLEDYSNNKYTTPSTRIIHNSSKYFFSINAYASESGYDVYYYDFKPGLNRIAASGLEVEWEPITKLFEEWLTALKKEIDIPDKWKRLQEGIPDFKLAADDVAGRFSYEDVILIETKVRLLKEKIKEIPLTAEQSNALDKKLDQCIELAKTSNKFDWASYFIGVITNIIITLSVTPGNAKHIWEAVKHVFNNFLLM